MHLATTLIQLAALGVLPAEFAAAVVIPGPRQAHFMTDRPMALRDIGGPAGGIHFYRRRSFQHVSHHNPSFDLHLTWFAFRWAYQRTNLFLDETTMMT